MSIWILYIFLSLPINTPMVRLPEIETRIFYSESQCMEANAALIRLRLDGTIDSSFCKKF
jgi:hypothetical protein